MKVLFLCKNIPYRRSNGIELKTYNLLQCMREVADVTSLFIVEDGRCETGTLASLKKGDHYYIDKRSRCAPLRYLKHLQGTIVVQEDLKKRLDAIIKDVRADVIWLEFGYISNLIPFLKNYGIPIYYGSHNSQWQLDYDIWRVNKNPADKLKMAPFLMLYWLQERVFMGQADRFFCISSQDIEYYSSIIDRSKLGLLPFFFDCRELENVPPARPGHPYICLVGSLKSYQNFQGALYAMEDLWPYISSLLRGLRLYIVGELPEKGSLEYRILMQRKRVDDGIEFAGKVETVIPFVKGALVNIVPIMLGSGVRTKIIESAACRTPVVSTSIGAEGLPFEDRKSILIGDDPRQFADHVIALVKDGNKRRDVAEKAFEIYRRDLSFEAGTAALRDILQCAADGGTMEKSMQ